MHWQSDALTTRLDLIDLFKGLKQIVSIGILDDFPTQRVGESFFDYEYLREYDVV